MIDDINLTQELSNHEINPANYIHALSVPSGVKVYLTTEYIPKLNFNELNPLRNNSKIHLKDSNDKYIPPIKCYIHTVGTSDQKLQIQTQSKHHNSDFTIEIEQQDNQTMTLEEQVTNQILELNKLINPYQEPIHISASMTLRNSLTTLLNKTLTCDKIQIDLSYYSNSWGIYQGNIFALLDGEPVTSLVMAGSNPVRSTKTTIENVNGKQLTIKFGSNNTYTHSFFGFHLQEFTKKP